MLLEWKRWCLELEKTETNIPQNLPTHLRSILKGKRLALLEKLSNLMMWPDSQIHKELAQGFKLVGDGTVSNIFREDVRPASITENELMDSSKFLRPKLLAKLRNAPNAEYNSDLNDITLKEAHDKGWLQGPMSEREVNAIFEGRWLPVERFAVRQKDKLRPIDNFASNRVNEAWGNVEKIDLHALDQLTWTMALICKIALGNRTVEIPLKDGSRLTGKLHDDWNVGNLHCKLTTLDMKDAYKQLGIHESERCRSVVSLRNDKKGCLDHYLMNCLPFGAVGSVHHFNRLARLLWAIGVYFLKLPWFNYFDDFPIISPAGVCSNTLAVSKTLFRLLGFGISVDKLKPFDNKAEILGIVVDSELFPEGKLKFRMKESRRNDLVEALQSILAAEEIVPRDLPLFLGRVQFADGQLMGRAGKLAMADIREIGLSSKESVKLDSERLEAFNLLLSRFNNNVAKCVALRDDQTPVLLFTDGSSETSGSMIGGVLIDGFKPTVVFGAHVPCKLIELWHRAGKEHIIGQVELYAIVVARYLWRDQLHNRRVLMFVDNWAVLDAYIPGTSKETTWRALMYFLEKIDMDQPCYAWATRVPSESPPLQRIS